MQPESLPPLQEESSHLVLFMRRFAIPLLIAGLLILLGAVYFGWNTYGADLIAQHELTTAQESFNNNDINSAIAQVADVIRTNPKNIDAIIQLSLYLAHKGSVEHKEDEFGTKAAQVAEQAIKIDASNSEAWRARGYAYEIMQNYREAHTSYDISLTHNKQNVRTLFDDAHVYDLEGNAGKAEQGYRAALAVDPTFVSAHAGLGRVLIGKNDRIAALNEFTTVYTTSKNKHGKAEAAYAIAMIHLVQKEYADALKYTTEATTLDPLYAQGWYGIGAVYFTQATDPLSKDMLAQRSTYLNKSTEALQDAIKLDPNLSAAYLQLSINFSMIGQFITSLQILDKAETAALGDITLTTSEKAAMIKRIQEVRNSLAVANKAALKAKK